MEYILNELSLENQYQTFAEFIDEGAKPLAGILSEIQQLQGIVLLKKSDLYNGLVYSGKTLYETFFNETSRLDDTIRKVKSKLSVLINEPYWDVNPQQKQEEEYMMEKAEGEEERVTGTSVAEAFAREGNLVSFNKSRFGGTRVRVKAKSSGESKTVNNIATSLHLIEFLRLNRLISIPEYIRKKQSGRLFFDETGERYGLNLVDETNLSLFDDAFGKFNQLSWDAINVDKGLDYKTFNENRDTKRYFSAEHWKKGIKKFRISQEIRCFGYVENGKFHVLRIDLDHELSDLG